MSFASLRATLRCFLSAFVVAAALVASAAAQKPTPPSALTKKVTLADFAWLAGRWQGTWDLRLAQQVWMPARAGVMVGTFQLTESDKTLVLEFFTLVETPDGISLYVRRFTPALAAWETSGPAVLHLTSLESKTAIFENPGDTQPRRVVFRRLDADTYVSRSEVVPESGAPRITEITYHRQTEPRPSRR